MAGGAGQSLPSVTWGLHPDQSYLGKPVDPDIVARVRGTLDKYQGPRSLQEHEKIVAAKCAAAQKFDRALSAEYWAWTKRVKEEGVASFTLPEDPRKDMPSQEEYIQANVERGLREMRKKNSEYKAWVASMEAKKVAEQRQQLEAKAAADEAFNNAADARAEDRRKRDEEAQAGGGLAEAQYWHWHREMKERVSKRPSSAPAARSSGVESASSMAQKKKLENLRWDKAIGSEYSSWVRSVSVPKFRLPTADMDLDGRKAKATAAKVRQRQARKEEHNYLKQVDEMKQKHHARIMGMVEDRLNADKQYNEDHEAFAESLVAKQQEEKQRQRAVTAKSRKELAEIYKRVKDKPLFLEKAYDK